jgi:hypothetical protein
MAVSFCVLTLACLPACGSSSSHGAQNAGAPKHSASHSTTTAPTVPSAWDAPPLQNPLRVTITNAHRDLNLLPGQDYVLRCPPGQQVLQSRLVVNGGHNVELEDCNLHVTSRDWAAYLEHQSGTLWVHDVHFGGSHLSGGIQMQEPGATVVMRDVAFDRVYGSYHTNHAELLQTWCGPKRLMIDGLSGSTTYQGLFMLPNQWCSTPLSEFDLRHISINDSDGAYALWLGDVNRGSPLRLDVSDVYIAPPRTRSWRGWWLWPQPPAGTWSKVLAGEPPGGTYVQPTTDGARGVDEAAVPTPLRTELN